MSAPAAPNLFGVRSRSGGDTASTHPPEPISTPTDNPFTRAAKFNKQREEMDRRIKLAQQKGDLSEEFELLNEIIAQTKAEMKRRKDEEEQLRAILKRARKATQRAQWETRRLKGTPPESIRELVSRIVLGVLEYLGGMGDWIKTWL